MHMSTLQSIGVVLIYPFNIPQPISLRPFLSFIKWFLATHTHTRIYFGFSLQDIAATDFGHSSLRHMWELIAKSRLIRIHARSHGTSRNANRNRSMQVDIYGFSFRRDCSRFLLKSLGGDGRSHEGKRDAWQTNIRARRTSESITLILIYY